MKDFHLVFSVSHLRLHFDHYFRIQPIQMASHQMSPRIFFFGGLGGFAGGFAGGLFAAGFGRQVFVAVGEAPPLLLPLEVSRGQAGGGHYHIAVPEVPRVLPPVRRTPLLSPRIVLDRVQLERHYLYHCSGIDFRFRRLLRCIIPQTYPLISIK